MTIHPLSSLPENKILLYKSPSREEFLATADREFLLGRHERVMKSLSIYLFTYWHETPNIPGTITCSISDDDDYYYHHHRHYHHRKPKQAYAYVAFQLHGRERERERERERVTIATRQVNCGAFAAHHPSPSPPMAKITQS